MVTTKKATALESNLDMVMIEALVVMDLTMETEEAMAMNPMAMAASMALEEVDLDVLVDMLANILEHD